MKKRITLLIAAALLTVFGAQATAVEKSITLTFANDATNGITWNLGNNTTFAGSTATFTSGTFNYSGWTFSESVNLTGFKVASLQSNCALSIMFTDEDNKSVWWHQWGPTNIGETIFDLSALANADEKPEFTKIKAIKFTNRETARKWDEGTSAYVEDNDNSAAITFGTITMTIQVDGYDEVINTYEKNSFTLSDANFSNTIWGTAEQNVVNTATGQISYSEGGNSVGWQFSPAIDLTQYDRLVVKVHPQSVTFSGDWGVGVSLFLDVDGKSDNEVYMEKWNSATNNEDSYFTREVDLTKTLKSGVDHDGTEVSVSAVTQFRFRTEGAALSFQIDEIYLEKDGEQYILRSNITADKYGTICLPFAVSVPNNATVYDVVGYYGTEASNPSALYLSEVNSLTAGKAYVFKSTDANDITFTKTGTDDNLNAPIASTNMLHGQFAGAADVPENSYILSSNTWKRVAAGKNNKVKNYRAYLTLDNTLYTTTPPGNNAPGMVVMDLAGIDVTAINATLNDKGQMTNDKVVYDLSGRKVAQPTKKGIYVKNGKKYVVK